MNVAIYVIFAFAGLHMKASGQHLMPARLHCTFNKLHSLVGTKIKHKLITHRCKKKNRMHTHLKHRKQNNKENDM